MSTDTWRGRIVNNPLIFKDLGLKPYETVWNAMRNFTLSRTADTVDEIWLVEHPAVFTQGQAGKKEHILNPGTIPVIQSDRGGQVTYHGPGQLILYVLLDIKRKGLGVKSLTQALEQSIIAVLAEYRIHANTDCAARGVYVEKAKIASLGLRIRKGCSYHGLSLNVAMDLEPFSRINPCGYANQKMVQMRDFTDKASVASAGSHLIKHLMRQLGYTELIPAEQRG